MKTRILIALCALGLWAQPVMAAIAVVSRAHGGEDAYSATIVSGAQTHAAGNGLIALFIRSAGAGDTVSTITNTAGDTFTQAADVVVGGQRISIYYVASSIGAASDVVTVTLAGGRLEKDIVVYEASGHNTAAFFNMSSSAGPTSTTSIASGTLTLVAPQELIVAFVQQYPVGTITGGSGYTADNHVSVGTAALVFLDEYKVVTASEAATATASTANPWVILAGSFRAAVTGSGRQMLLGVGN